MPSATVKRPRLLTDVFLRQQDESQSNNWPGFDRFGAHNARLGVLNIVVHFALLPRLLPFMVVSSRRIFSLSFGRSRGHSLVAAAIPLLRIIDF